MVPTTSPLLLTHVLLTLLLQSRAGAWAALCTTGLALQASVGVTARLTRGGQARTAPVRRLRMRRTAPTPCSCTSCAALLESCVGDCITSSLDDGTMDGQQAGMHENCA